MKEMIKKFLGIISSVIPKKNIILFESKSDFADSSKALYEECLKQHVNEKYKIVWFVEKPEKFCNIKEKNVVFTYKNNHDLKNNIKKIFYYMVAKYCFYTHSKIGLYNNKGQIRYFLTHAALPIKNSAGKFWQYKFNTYIECTSDFTKKYRCKSFLGGEDRAIILGLPRNDYLFSKINIFKELNIPKYNKIIVWMPTFKHMINENRNDYLFDKEKDITMLNEDTLAEVNNYLKNNNSLLIVKFHPSQDMNYVDTYSFSNIMFLTNNDLINKKIDIYKLLGQSDALITDFSSVYVDYLLLDKPIGFELTDKELYAKGIGFMLGKPLEYMPGEKIYNKNDLIKFINHICNNKDEYKMDRNKMRKLCHKYEDDKSAYRILKFLGILDKEE